MSANWHGAEAALWPSVADSELSLRFVEAGGVRTRVLEAGEGEPLVLMHGTGGHLEAYLRNAGSLARHFRVIAFDFVGHGYSAAPDHPYTLDVYANQLLGLLDALGLDRANLSGESLGGWVAAWFAARHPDRVLGTVLAVPGNVTDKRETMDKIRSVMREAVANASPETVRTRLEWLFAAENRHLVTDELVRIRYEIYTQPDALRTVENVLALQDPEVRSRFSWSPEWCSRIAAPTLVLWTEHDPTGSEDEGRLLQSWIAGSSFHSIPGAGHWPQWERPEEYERMHREFLLAANPAREGQ